MAKPKIFIGSSGEALPIARAVKRRLNESCSPTLWKHGVFRLSRSTLEDLEKALDEHEFGLLILTPDDKVTSRGKKSSSPRDNILFELGLFVGRRGRERTFVVCDPKVTKIPSDWQGITVASFEWRRARNLNEVDSAVDGACRQVLQAIRSVPRSSRRAPAPTGDFGGIDELYLAISKKSGSQSAVVILHDDTSWAWKLFPTVLEWTLSGVPVTTLLSPAHGDQKQLRQEHYRRQLLKNLGVRVVAQKSLPLRGFFFDAKDENNLEALLLTEDSSGYKPLAFAYDANDQREAAQALLRNVPPMWRETRLEFRPSLRAYPDKDVRSILLDHVSQYKQQGVTMEPAFVRTRDLQVISEYTRAYKYQQVKCLVERYKAAGVKPFKPLAIRLKDDSTSIVTPPVVEKTPDGLIVIEGNTRATYCLQNKIDSFFCLLVEGVTEPPPGRPWPLTEVRVSERTLPPEERMPSFEYARFRHIERAMHPY